MMINDALAMLLILCMKIHSPLTFSRVPQIQFVKAAKMISRPFYLNVIHTVTVTLSKLSRPGDFGQIGYSDPKNLQHLKHVTKEQSSSKNKIPIQSVA